MEEPQDDADGEAPSGGINPELIKSYLAFARRGIRAHRFLGIAIFVVGASLTFAAAAFLPRTFVAKTVMMTQAATVLDRNDASSALQGAQGLIMRRENLEGIIRDTGVMATFQARRPPLLRLKDRMIAALFGPMDEKSKLASLVGTLESKIEISTERSELSISVSWGDGKTAADLAAAARESFLKARHTAEIAAFEDKMAILDGHASKLREEVAVLADQMNAEVQGAAVVPATSSDAPTAPAPRRAPARVAAVRNPNAMVSEQLSTLKAQLAADKPKLAEAEADWQRRLREEQSKLAELQLNLTPSHPTVVMAQQRLALLTQVPPPVSALRAEIATLEGDIKARELMSPRSAGGGTAAVPGAETLPPAIMQALEKDDADPALRAQLSGAIVKYGDLRNSILSSRIDLDTAQAAFNHRYQIMAEAEVPSRPVKPKVPTIIGGGLVASLLLALLVPILAELRKGVIVETWQVHELQLPVLAELRLPPRSD